ncbi:MAG: thymidylate synthase [Proteobacteria bacterium]|nr:thymidylate synthase [Pseudomonadota bacterium]NBP15012.1 thymidylate synthase [bacterium]
MPINLIACVANYRNQLAIGRNNGLLYRIRDDLNFFKFITTESLSPDSKALKNVVVMGRKTWFSIPRNKRPLPDRINIVLTNDPDLHKLSPYPKALSWFPFLPYDFNTKGKNTYFMTFSQFENFYARTNANVWVIGGGEIYRKFLQSADLKPQKVYLTEIIDYKPAAGHEPDAFMDALDWSYKLIGHSDKKYDAGTKQSYRFLRYATSGANYTDEKRYLDLCEQILKQGNERVDRTGVGTISSFGHQLKFDISETVPLLTTKRVPWKHVIEELLWFMRGDTDAKILQRKGVKIWDGNTSREFLDARGLTNYEEGVLGAGYGWQWRFFGAKYSQAFADTSQIEYGAVGGVDQLNYVLRTLHDDPYSRRILMSYWNPPDFDKTALLPCHYSVQFYVEDRGEQRYLDCHFTMRSNDLLLGHPFNIFSYTVMTYILAVKLGMKPGRLVYTGGDVHIYKNHLEQMETQLSRVPRPFPKLYVNPDVKYKDWHQISIDDFDIIGYFPHPPIRAPMAV